MVTKEVFLPTQRSKLRCLWIILAVLIPFIIDNSFISSKMDIFFYTYVLKPVIWLGIIYMVWKFPNIHPVGQLRHKKLINLWAFNFAVIYIIASVIIGLLIDGLGKSPYSHSFFGIISNIYIVGITLTGRELVRNYLTNNLAEEENYLVFVFITIFMTILEISVSKVLSLDGLESTVQFLAQEIAPSFSDNLLATYLVFLGGPLSSILYLAIVQGFEWLSPVLPNLQWITKALIGVLLPTFFLMSIQSIYLQASKEIKVRDKDKENPIAWIITSVISICIVWFAVGVFPVYPSVIATGSMEPMMKPGDVILVNKIVDMNGINNLKEGDVIQFNRDSILISHRIIEVKETEKGIRFLTRGDNNSGPDIDLVKPEDVRGTIVYVIPKIGWPTLLMKGDKDLPLEEIVF